MKQIPNVLSAMRILMVGGFVYYFLHGRYVVSLCIFITAVLTDTLDGYLARNYNWVTNLGKVLDPLADKLMLIAALICFCIRGWIPVWLASIVVAKELIMITGGLFLYRMNIVVHADWFGKCATAFFNAGIIATMCKGFWPWLGMLHIALLLIAALLAIVALIHYARQNVFLRKDELRRKKDA